MKREEKNNMTRQRIIDAALDEFGEKNYAEASLNTICTVGNISKGIIYQYYKDKGKKQEFWGAEIVSGNPKHTLLFAFANKIRSPERMIQQSLISLMT